MPPLYKITMGNKTNIKFVKNYAFNTAYKLTNIITPLITAPYLARMMGAEALGNFAYYYAIAHYFYLVGKMGLNNYGTRQIAFVADSQDELNRTFSSIYIQQLFFLHDFLYEYFAGKKIIMKKILIYLIKKIKMILLK